MLADNYNYVEGCDYRDAAKFNEISYEDFMKKSVFVSPMMLTVTGLPGSNSYLLFKKAFTETQHSSANSQFDNDDQFLIDYHFAAGIEDDNFMEAEDKLYLLVAQSSCMMSNEIISEANIGSPSDSQLMQGEKKTDEDDQKPTTMLELAHQFLQATSKHIQLRRFTPEYESIEIDKTLHESSRKEKAEHKFEQVYQQLECSLKNGICMMKVFNVPVTGCISQVLESLCQLFTQNHILMFASLGDVRNLHLPPFAKVANQESTGFTPVQPNEDQNQWKWKPRIQYLLRTSQFAMFSQGYHHSPPCKLALVDQGNSTTEPPSLPENSGRLREILETECKIAAKQLNLAKLIDCKPINGKNEEDIRKQIYEFKKRSRFTARNVNMSWILLQGFLSNYKEFYITWSSLKEIAGIFCIDSEVELNEFCNFFSSFGMLFNIRKINKNSDYLIIKPIKFLNMIKKIQSDITEEVQSGTQKFETKIQRTKSIQVIVEILISLNHALQYKNPSLSNGPQIMHYIPIFCHGKTDSFCSDKAVRLVVDIKSPKTHIGVKLLKELLNSKNIKWEMQPNLQFINKVKLMGTALKGLGVLLTFQGNVIQIEFALEHHHHDAAHEELQPKKKFKKQLDVVYIPSRKYGFVISHIIKACDQVFEKELEAFKHVNASFAYQFSILCVRDRIGKTVSANLHRIEHTLPVTRLDEFCEDYHGCCHRKNPANHVILKTIGIWSQELIKV